MILWTDQRKYKLSPETRSNCFCPGFFIDLQGWKFLLHEMIIEIRGRKNGRSLNPPSEWSQSRENFLKLFVKKKKDKLWNVIFKIAYYLY